MAVTTMTAAPEVPLISLRRSTPEEILHALSTIGFIHLELDGTGISQHDVRRAFELSTLIHSVPEGERIGALKDASGNGYFGMKGSLDERNPSKVDLKESFVWGRYSSSSGQTETSQNLPVSIQKHKREIVDFDHKCFEASLRVLDSLSEALGVWKHRYFHTVSY